ncbi:MAG TPA: mechanosensitive ion channel domain-containing protein [Xanthobacteraceae bacterium]|nr:mechanosensitive ion channel domain-containing protein [Xanthobacteraceae bacterium]
MQASLLNSALSEMQDALTLIPDGVRSAIVAAIMAVIAIVAALIAHHAIMALVRRPITHDHPFLKSLLVQMEGPLRLALILFALTMAVGAAPLEATLKFVLSRALQLTFVALLGWMALACSNILAALYLLRYDITAPDNLLARKHFTQVRVLKGALNAIIVVITIGAALMTFDSVREIGVGLFASAGIAGIVAGLAARPVLSNLLAGVQLALTQPIRVDDVVVVEKEWGRIEDITMTYVVIRLWDLRRLVVPLSYFIEKPFENWTRESATVIGTVFIYADYTVPIDRVRKKLEEIVAKSDKWDGDVAKLQVTDTKESSIELRILVSARDSGSAFDLRAEVREQLIAFLAHEHPEALPHGRLESVGAPKKPESGVRDIWRSRGA